MKRVKTITIAAAIAVFVAPALAESVTTKDGWTIEKIKPGDKIGRYQFIALPDGGSLVVGDTLTGKAWRCWLNGAECQAYRGTSMLK